MAIIKAVSGKNKGSIARVIHYIMKKEKTDLKLITGINCEGSTDCIQQMKMTKAMYKKEGEGNISIMYCLFILMILKMKMEIY